MAQPQSKYDLRQRNLSTTTPLQPTNTTGKEKEDVQDSEETLLAENQTNSATQTTAEEIVEVPLIAMEHFRQAEISDKLDLLMSAINTVNTNFHHKFDAVQRDHTTLALQFSEVLPKITELQTNMSEVQARVDDAEGRIAGIEGLKQKMAQLEGGSLETIKNLKDKVTRLETSFSQMNDEVFTLKGFVQVRDKQITTNKNKIVDLTARSMANNIVIYGLTPDLGKEEHPKAVTLEFIKSKLQMDIRDEDVIVAHRMGSKIGAKPRPMIVRCSQILQNTIFSFTKNLKDLCNAVGDLYNVKQQLPEPLLMQKKERDEKYRAIKRANDQLPDDQKDQKTSVEIRNKTLYVNNKPQTTYIFPPTVQDMYEITPEQQKKIDEMTYVFSNKEEEKGSTFRVVAMHVKATSEVKLAYKKTRQLFPESDHIIMAYKVKSFEGYHDNGEHGAGTKVLQLLNDRTQENTVVFVTRKYGGLHLVQRRFMYIQSVAKDALNKLIEHI